MFSYKEVKLEIYLPFEFIEPIVAALSEMGACVVGAYDHVSSYSPVGGTWRPLSGSRPVVGEVDQLSRGTEYKLELRCPLDRAKAAIEEIKRVHPYEEAVINVLPLLDIV